MHTKTLETCFQTFKMIAATAQRLWPLANIIVVAWALAWDRIETLQLATKM